MASISIQALRFKINDGVTDRPIFMGSLPVSTLNDLAEVPAFSSDTSQYEIADHVLSPPISRWQRPLIQTKVDAIAARFNQNGEFMPNPVLLAVHRSDLVEVSPEIRHGVATGVYSVTLEIPDSGDKPLWVLDGQHRLRGLSQSVRAGNPIPFVLLHSEAEGVYTPEIFAKIFAEVSTEASPLKDLHREWLQYAFRLGIYDPQASGNIGQDSSIHRKAMEATAILCKAQTFDDGALVNPFFNKIQFNPERPASPAYGAGFAFTAPQLKEMIFKEYFKQPAGDAAILSPVVLAREIAAALKALIESVGTAPEKSAFSGNGAKHHQYMEEGFICGVLSRLLKYPRTDWKQLLEVLKFPVTDWELVWVDTTGGSAGTVSKRIARDVFVETFQLGSIPHGSDDLVTYFQGDKATVNFVASFLTAGGTPAQANKNFKSFDIGGVSVFATDDRPHVKLQKTRPFTSNVGKLKIQDPTSPYGDEITFTTLKRGVKLTEAQPLLLLAETYGGLTKEFKITIKPTSA